MSNRRRSKLSVRSGSRSTLYRKVCRATSEVTSNVLRKQSELMYAAHRKSPSQIKQENRMVKLIPSQDAVMQILKRTGAFREGHFIYPNGKHSPHYFQMPLAFRYYDTARVLAVALSRKFRLEKDISSQLPKV